MPAPTATSVCCARASVANRRTAHADGISANFLKYSPLVSSFRLWDVAARLVVPGEAAANGRAGRKNFGGRTWLPRTQRATARKTKSLVWADRVPDRRSYADNVSRGKIGSIVEDFVVEHLGADEEDRKST